MKDRMHYRPYLRHITAMPKTSGNAIYSYIFNSIQYCDGCVALHIASAHGHYDAVQVLLSAGAAVHKADRTDDTALHHAARCGRHQVIQLLVQAGTEVDRAGFELKTAVHLCELRCGSCG